MEQIIDEVCAYLNNWFVEKPSGIHAGDYTITGGAIDCDFLQANQYFRVVGSVFNDGVWKYPASQMTNEEFAGEVWAMALPPAFIALIADITAWQTAYGGASSPNMSPYSAESFNNYSYTKATGGSN